MLRPLSILLLALWLGACSSLLKKPEAPQVALAGVVLTDASLFEQTFILKLRVSNPNNFDLPISALHYQLEFAGKEFMRGQNGAAVTIPQNGSAYVEVEAHTNLLELARQLRSLGTSDKLSYRLKGDVVVGYINLSLPFDRSGEFDTGGLLRHLPR